MKITRDVILDLLPLYLAGEASQDTRELVENYLENDQELATLAKRTGELELSGNNHRPIKMEDQMKAYNDAQRAIQQKTIILGAVIGVVLLAVLGFIALIVFMGFSVP